MVQIIRPKVCKRCWKRNGVKNVRKDEVEEEENCRLCLGSFLKIDKIADSIVKELDSIPATRTFSIGTSLPKSSEVIEEQIWDTIDIKNAKSIKTELNTEIGKVIEKKTGYRFHPDPDVRIIYRVDTGRIDKLVSSLYLYGKYNKLKRGIRQTKKEGANEESVEGLIERILIRELGTKNSKAILHGSGREDIDVLMLGEGRLFIMELTNPKKRELSQSEIESINEKINRENEGKIKVSFSRVVPKGLVEVIKRAKFDKEYEAIVKLDKPIDKNELKLLPNSVILMQRTPKRVLIRRADKIRKRKIKSLSYEWIDEKTIKLHIVSQSGTYIKEFISGDDGRTKPSISSLLKRNAICEQLNVLSIHSEWLDDFW